MKRLSEEDIVKLLKTKQITLEDMAGGQKEDDDELINPQLQALEAIATSLDSIQSANKDLVAKFHDAISELIDQLKVERSPNITVSPPEVNVSVPPANNIAEWEFVIIRDSKGLIEKITAIAK